MWIVLWTMLSHVPKSHSLVLLSGRIPFSCPINTLTVVLRSVLYRESYSVKFHPILFSELFIVCMFLVCDFKENKQTAALSKTLSFSFSPLRAKVNYRRTDMQTNGMERTDQK